MKQPVKVWVAGGPLNVRSPGQMKQLELRLDIESFRNDHAQLQNTYVG